MQKIADYLIIVKISETRNSLIYRARKESDANTVIIKILKTKSPSASEIARFKHEYEIIKDIDLDGVVKNIELIEHGKDFALVLEDFDGISVKERLKNKPFALLPFLKTGIRLAETIGNLHKNKIIHKDLKPHNILINEKKGLLKITDFGISTELTHENDEIFNPDVIEGTLAYMSPEQTGRMNQDIDYRTDFYTLGVTFYEMLTGTLPFKLIDPLEIIHAHIAKNPVPPCELKNDIPETVSNIILKLMSKKTGERYQNSFGLMFDLKKCLNAYNENGTVGNFTLGEKDIPIKFYVPHLIVGREKEIDRLITSFERAVNNKSDILPARLMLVSGYPGIGKSALIHEVHKPIVARRGYFISGKFDQFRRDVPYSAIRHAFQGMISQILAEGEARMNIWRAELHKAFGPIGKVITDIIPTVTLITGPQPEIQDLTGEASVNRFNYAFRNFTAVLANEDHPLVLFLDDLQWADAASLKLLQILITDPELRHLYIIGAYRNNKSEDIIRVTEFLEEIKKTNAAVDSISLSPLTVSHINILISAFLHCDTDATLPLAEIIFKKTEGNPFFVNMFIKALYEEDILKLDFETGWHWDISEIKKMQVTDNVVELLVDKITRLPYAAQQFLKISACIGNRFDLMTVAHITGKTLNEAFDDLSIVIEEGFVFLSGDIYRFQHDRIQEACFSLIPENERAKIHYQIGSYLLKSTPDNMIHDKIIYIADQLNAARSIMLSSEEKYKLANLNAKAGKKALSSAAYESALRYNAAGIEAAGEDCWKNDYELALTLYTQAAQTAYLSIKKEEFKRFSIAVLNNAASLMDKITIYELQILQHMSENKLTDAVNTALAALKMFGISFPKKPRLYHVLAGLLNMMFILRNKTKEDLLTLPEMADPEKLAVMKITRNVASSAFYTSPLLLPLLVFKTIKLSLKYGNTADMPYTYIGYGFILSNLGKINEGYEYGTFAIRLLEKINRPDAFPKTHVTMNAILRHWKEHIQNSLDMYRLSRDIALEIGDIEFECHSLSLYVLFSFHCGRNLEELEQTMKKSFARIKQLKQKTSLAQISTFYQLTLILLGKEKYSSIIEGSIYNESIILPRLISTGDRGNIGYLHTAKMLLSYIFYDYRAGIENTKKAKRVLDAIPGTVDSGLFYFYDSLIRLSAYDNSKNKNKLHLKKIFRNQKKIKRWMHHAPMNYEHKYYLIEAELARISGRHVHAVKNYSAAIQGAHKNKFIHEEGIAHELAANFWINNSVREYAKTHLKEAYRCFSQWGAQAKLSLLELKYPEYIKTLPAALHETKTADKSNQSDTSSGTVTNYNLDLSTIIKLSQKLSGEIDLKKLMENIMKLSIENAGAEKGCLIMEHSNARLYMETCCHSDKITDAFESKPVELCEIPLSVINYTHKTGESIVLQNAYKDTRFLTDAYIMKNKSQSILCMPVRYKGKTSGILYLENSLVSNAFTPQRLEILQIISAQAAISIENSQLLLHRENSAKLQKEMEIAAGIQTGLLPRDPHIDNYEIAAYMQPADNVGGDYYDIINVSGKDWLVIGDVSGHGVDAGLIMMMVQACIHNTLNMQPDIAPSALLTLVNKTITENIGLMNENKYVTITVFTVLENGKFIFSGLHLDVLIYRANTDTVEVIETEGTWLGLFDDVKEIMKDKHFELNPGDTMILFTDGITEAYEFNNPYEMFGSDRLKNILLSSGKSNPEEIKSNILKALDDYNCKDDVSMVILKRIN